MSVHTFAVIYKERVFYSCLVRFVARGSSFFHFEGLPNDLVFHYYDEMYLFEGKTCLKFLMITQRNYRGSDYCYKRYFPLYLRSES